MQQKKVKIFISICLFIWSVSTVSGQSSAKSTRNRQLTNEAQVLSRVFKDYVSDHRPPVSGCTDRPFTVCVLLDSADHSSIVVIVSLLLNRVRWIADYAVVDMNLRQQWQDSRLAFEADGLDEVTVSGRHRVWNPDTYISSAAEESAARRRRVIIEASGFVRLSENRRVELPVIYGNRLAMANSRSFRIRLSSFVYPLEDVVFVWANSPPTVVPVEVAGDLLEGSFRFSEALAGDCIGNYTMGTYSCIDVLVTFEGSSSEGLLRWFIPSIFLVIASWLHFWIHGSWSVPRTISAALPFFFFVAFLVFFPQPSLSHSTSEGFNGVQVWLFFCLILTFCSLLEYFVVICCGVRRSTIRMLNGTVAEDVPLNANRDTIYANAMDIGPSETRCASCKQHAGLDLVSRLLFPVVFLIGTVLLLIIYSL